MASTSSQGYGWRVCILCAPLRGIFRPSKVGADSPTKYECTPSGFQECCLNHDLLRHSQLEDLFEENQAGLMAPNKMEEKARNIGRLEGGDLAIKNVLSKDDGKCSLS
jgi:hypothetical protein